MLYAFLSFADHEVVVAENGAKALDLFNGDSFDLVITDLWMPEMNGIELIKHVRETGKPCKVLAITGAKGEGFDTSLKQAMEAGADATLPKPFGRDELFKQLDALLGEEEAKD